MLPDTPANLALISTFWAVMPHVFLIVGVLLGLAVLVQLVRQRRAPQATIAWALAILLIPYVGIPLYLLIGGRKLRRIMNRKETIYLPGDVTTVDEPVHTLDRLLRGYNLPGATRGNRVSLHTRGEDAFDALMTLIDEAEHQLDITMFILTLDDAGRPFVDRLTQRVADGLRVRLLLDYVGCLHSLGRRLDEFKSAGGELGLFMPVGRFSLRRRIDLRSHRKIAIADGTRCWTGGMNIATEYMGPSPKRDRWVDLAYSIEGPAVRLLWEVFRRDWEFATDQQLVPLTEQDFAKGDGSSSTQVVPSGPDIDGDPLYDSILAAIHAAEKRAWVVTPYFVPDEILMNALILAVRRGVDVRLIMPERSNHPLTDLVRGSYLRELQSRGARICLYEAGMMHAKGMLFDDVALLGSMNLDARSLFLNYEIATYLYDREAVAEVEGWMRSLLARCRSGVRPVGAVRDFFEGVVRMGAPLL